MSIPVRRVGNLNQYAIVLCRTEQGTATSSSAWPPGQQDYVEYAGQVGWGHRRRRGHRPGWQRRQEGSFPLGSWWKAVARL